MRAKSAIRAAAPPRIPSALSLKVLVILLTGCSPALSSSPPTAPDLRPELEVSGRVDSIEVNSAGEIWFGTAAGRVYVSKDWNHTWSEVPVPVRKSGPTSYSYDSISQVRFFDSQHAIITGYLGESQNLGYRTADGGASWSTVTLPSGFWVYDSRSTPEGLAWLVGSNGAVLFSADFGASWSAFTPPFDQTTRSHTVHFVSRSLGIVGSLHGSLKVTRNGGRSWRRIKTPTETGAVTCEEDRVERARIFGDKVVLQQCGGVFSRGLTAKGPWQQVRAADRALLSYELSAGGLIAVASDLEIVRCLPDLRSCRSTGLRLEAYPLDIAVGAGKVVLVDGNLKVSVLDGEGFKSSRMLQRGTATHWPITERDRGSDGAFWGISRFFLYRSSDVGRTWERQVELPREVDGLAVQASGDILLWSRHGYVCRWNPGSGRLLPVPGLEGLDIVGLFRRDDLWLAYGGMQYQTTQRIEVARTYFSGQFAGSVDHGFIAASSDGGGTWRVVDEWKDGGVQTVFLGEDDTLTLLSWLCAVRRGRLTIDQAGRPTASLETILPANENTWHQVPYVERAHILDFLGGTDGWVKGWTHHLGDFLFHTVDGGKTWERTDLAKRPPDQLYRLGNGSWLGLISPHEFQIWNDGSFVPFRRFPEEIKWSLVDATGSLVLQLDNGQTWLLQPDAKHWQLLSSPESSAN